MSEPASATFGPSCGSLAHLTLLWNSPLVTRQYEDVFCIKYFEALDSWYGGETAAWNCK